MHSSQNPEDNLVLIEQLRKRLERLSYLALALIAQRVFRELGLSSVKLLGRRYLRGRTKTGGADMDATVETNIGRHGVLIQVKRYTRPVPRHFVDELRGVMLRVHAPQAIILATSSFSRAARKAAGEYLGRPIRLIDGSELARMMVARRIGIRQQENLLTGEMHWTIDEEAFSLLREFCRAQHDADQRARRPWTS